MGGNPQTAARRPAAATFAALAGGYCELAKPSIVWLILMSTVVGCYLAADGPFPLGQVCHVLIATGLLAAGTGALNQWSERAIDRRMRRTQSRPVPAGRVSPRSALAYSLALIAAGLAYLLAVANALSFALGVFTVVSYNFVYTPLKTRTWWSTALGAFPGAVPPLLGWAALRGSLGIEAWVLYGLLFLWQFPHFYAIAWMYREDYGRAGIRMLPVIEPSGESTHRQILASSALLVPVSMSPAWLGMVEAWYSVPVLLLSLGYLAYGVKFARSGSRSRARDLLKASVLYLPLVYLLLVVAGA